MQALAEIPMLLAALLGGWEMLLIITIVLIIFGARNLSDIARGLKSGLFEFRKAARDEMDEMAKDAGRSLGGIYGKRAADAITPDNQIAELYEPEVFRRRVAEGLKSRKGWRRRWQRIFARMWRLVWR